MISANITESPNTTTSTVQQTHEPQIDVILGVVFGVVVLIALVVCIVLYVCRKKKFVEGRHANAPQVEQDSDEESSVPLTSMM